MTDTRSTPQDDSREKAKAAFIEWFEQNYPPDCILSRPSWHAPKIFNAAFHAMSSARSERTAISDARIKELVRNAVYGGMKCEDVSLSECIEHAIRTALAEDKA